MADEDFDQFRSFAFLNETKNKFIHQFGIRWKNAIAFSMQTAFSRTLAQLMEYYSDSKNMDRIRKVHGALEDVKKIMVDNIELVMARGQKIESIVDKTDHMASSSITFKKSSTSLKRSMYFKNIKMWIIIGVALLILAYIIAAIVCKSPIFKGCWSKKTEPPQAPSVPTAPKAPTTPITPKAREVEVSVNSLVGKVFKKVLENL